MKNYSRAILLVFTGSVFGGASDFTLKQAKDSAGTDAKELVIEKNWKKQSSAYVSDEVETVGNSVTVDTVDCIYAVEVNNEDFDTENSFTHFQVLATDPAASSFYSASMIFYAGGTHKSVNMLEV